MRARISLLLVVVLTLLAGMGATLPARAEVPLALGAADTITVTTTADPVLAGAAGRVVASVGNPDGAELYNSVAVAVLPVGVTYKKGSSAPSTFGEPTVRSWIPDANQPSPEAPATAQVLIWSNIADLPVGSTTDLSFGSIADPDVYPAGSTFTIGVGF